MMRLSALLAATVLAFAIPACGSDEGGAGGDGSGGGDKPSDARPGSPEDDPAVVAEKLAEKPWEVVSNKGETYLPNVFYADDVENEQIMPYAFGGHTMIDRLVYPTLGNPNLYVKGDAEDQFMIVLRLEDEAYAHLSPKMEEVSGSPLKKLVVPNDPQTGFAVFLVPRTARAAWTESTEPISSGNGTGVVRVYPNEILVSPEPADMPASLKKRKTLRFVFRQAAMQRVPAGLYDVRFEVRKDNELYRPKTGMPGIYEWQYNAVRVFDTEPEEYPVVNVTDTQVSVGMTYDAKTRDKLEEFVQYLNTTNDANVRKAAFITFNGDLHNGGSPGSLRQRTVAHTYEEEAKAIVDQLKFLPFPIFLTAGNHDGYVSVGHVPSAVKALDTGLGESLKEVIDEAKDKPWPGFQQSDFDAYLKQTEGADMLGGLHKDIFTGSFTRTANASGFGGWKEVARKERNFILYDGFYQWQKTYGPLYYSWKFGKSAYLSLNSFDLRQHRRSGWGMYTVNYGGGMSDVQMQWLDRELLRAKTDKSDVVVLAHHDPRGGNKGKDFGYYFEQLEFRSVYQSAINYLASNVWNPQVCKLPPWALSRDQEESCVHDGLQEWMRPDPELDGDYVSGMELMKLLSKNAQVRTVLLGHTHYNALEVLQGGDQLLPGQLAIDGAASQKFATLEVQNPLRGYSLLGDAYASGNGDRHADYDGDALAALSPSRIERSYASFSQVFARATPGWQRTLDGPAPGTTLPRELVIMRLVSNADLASQTYSDGKNAMGFSVLHVAKSGAYPTAQINKATFFANTGSANFTNLKTITIPRTQRLQPHDPTNPVEELFDW